MIQITEQQMEIIREYMEEGEEALGASLIRSTPFYILKAINDEIKATGLTWQYDLNERGEILQKLYEEIYDQNREMLNEDGTYPKR
ncbi:MAG: hypothetical protein HUJ54_03510 [Erysipelotrichaceae bacterium]|nr:hypothetical protein [Erysipelotrichaceae bacterium]